MKTNFRNQLCSILLISLFFAAEASARFPIRFGGTMGLWGGNFNETYASTTASTTINWDASIGARVGFPFKLFYVDYTPSYFGVGKTDGSGNGKDAYYFAPISFEFGISGIHSEALPPFEAFVGLELGTLEFTSGTQSKLSSTTYKIGAEYLPFHFGKYQNLGFRAEYRRHSLSIDNYGSISGFSSSMSSYYVGVVYLFDSYLKKSSEAASEEPKKVE